MYSPVALALAAAPLVLVAQAGVDLDLDKVPSACRTICRPVGQLADACDTDLNNVNDRDEKLLKAQCVCTNKSFDVAQVAALCAACMHQQSTAPRKRDDDDRDRAGSDRLREIDNVLATCGFASTTYAPAATSLVQGITVAASAPTDVSQLTTTLAGSSTNAGDGASRGASGTASNGGSSTASSGDGATPTSGSVTATTTSSFSQASGALTSQAAAPSLQPLGGVSAAAALYIAGAVLTGEFMMLG